MKVFIVSDFDLADFHLRAHGKWSDMGKGLPRALRCHALGIAETYLTAFDKALRDNQNEKIFELAEIILKPFGGNLLHYEQKAGPQWRGFKGPGI